MFHSLFAPGSGFYIVQFRLDFQQLNKEAFQRAWQEVINRHEILRTAFVSEGAKEPLQVVLSKVALTWHEEDWRGSRRRGEQKLQAYMEWDRAEDYDLTCAADAGGANADSGRRISLCMESSSPVAGWGGVCRC